MLILTLPALHQEDLVKSIIEHSTVGAVRYNTGTPSAYSPFEVVSRINKLAAPLEKPVYIDLKGKQLRIVEWGVVPNSPIILNHDVEIELPARIVLRGGESCEIREVVNGNELYIESRPQLVGKGQSVNIFAKKLVIKGGLLDLDHTYIKAALAEGVTRFMLSFVENIEDVRELEEAIFAHSKGEVLIEDCEIIFKIESKAGLEFVRNKLSTKNFAPGSPYRLMAARDDLMIHVGVFEMIDALNAIIGKDPKAICASRLLMGLEDGGVTMADVSDVELMRLLGYSTFMLSDGISQEYSREAIAFWSAFQKNGGA